MFGSIFQMHLPPLSWIGKAYEVVPKIFGTGAAIYTAVEVARSTGAW